jgi:hypothetical protein
MTRVLVIIAAIVPLAVAATASAGTTPRSVGVRMDTPRTHFVDIGTTETLDLYAGGTAKGRLQKSNTIAYAERHPSFTIDIGTSEKLVHYNGHAGLGANAKTRHYGAAGIVNASGGWDPTLRVAQARRAQPIVMASVAS